MSWFSAKRNSKRAASAIGPGSIGGAMAFVGVAGVGTALSMAVQMRAIYKSDAHANALTKAFAAIYGSAPTPFQSGAIDDVPTAIRYAIRKKELKSVHKSGQMAATVAGGAAGAAAGSIVPIAGTIVGGIVGGAVGFTVSVGSTWTYRAIHFYRKGEQQGVHRKAAADKIWFTMCQANNGGIMDKDDRMACLACIEIMGNDFFGEGIAALNSGRPNVGAALLFDKLKSW